MGACASSKWAAIVLVPALLVAGLFVSAPGLVLPTHAATVLCGSVGSDYAGHTYTNGVGDTLVFAAGGTVSGAIEDSGSIGNNHIASATYTATGNELTITGQLGYPTGTPTGSFPFTVHSTFRGCDTGVPSGGTPGYITFTGWAIFGVELAD